VIDRRLAGILGISSIFLMAMAAATLSLPTPAAAADPPAQLQVEVQEQGDGYWTLRATLTRGGALQTGQSVDFYQIVDFFGERRVPLGTAVTDAAGVASRIYSPTSNGAQHILARYSAADGTFESDPFEITVSGAVPVIPEEGPVLPIVQGLAFPVGAAVLALVWLALAFILLRAVVGVSRRAAAEVSDTASMREGPIDRIPQETRNTE